MITRRRQRRPGNILALTAFFMVLMIALLALAIDVGYVYMARAQLQRSADAAAIAATWELLDEGNLTATPDMTVVVSRAVTTASDYAALNNVGNISPTLGIDDVEVGYLVNPSDPTAALSFVNLSQSNAVTVRVRKATNQNGEIPLFFGRIFGLDSLAYEAQATAALVKNFGGFRAPPDGSNLELLPFALDQQTWNDMLGGIASDDWTWDAELEQVFPGADGVLEVNLYPQGTGSPGNRGTVDIGSSNNSTADISRQIVDGISSDDLDYHGGQLQFDVNGELSLNGDTGLSAGIKDELASIIGEPRIIPIFSALSGNGNNAQYTIVQFAGIRILEVKLTGSMSSKRVIIQPAQIVAKGGIPSTSATPKTLFVYSPVWLVR